MCVSDRYTIDLILVYANSNIIIRIFVVKKKWTIIVPCFQINNQKSLISNLNVMYVIFIDKLYSFKF